MDDATAGPAAAGPQQLAPPFDLRGIVADVVTHTDETDYTAIAGVVAGRIPRQHLLAALEAALVPMVRETAGLCRVRVHTAARRPPGGESPKVAAIRAMVQARLRENVWVGGGEGGTRKLLGACTAADLGEAIRRRREQAARCLEVAGEYERLRGALEAHGGGGARVVADLPARVLADLLYTGTSQAGAPAA